MEKKIGRRSFIQASTAGAAAVAAGMILPGAAGRSTAQAAPAMAALNAKAGLPAAKGPRVVVVGGGWSGLTVAKYVKKENPKLDVVLIESRATFQSCPISNLWLAGLVDYEFLSHSYLDAAKNNNYTFFNATVVELDRTSRKVYTEQGVVDYDYLVLAPGIDYDYAAIGVKDPGDEQILRTSYPAGFRPGSEHLSIKQKLAAFEGGTFLLTVPSGNYRCLPAPYERACMIASVLKKNKIKGKVLLLDASPDVKIKTEGFHAAFDELYKGYLEYVPSVNITGVNIAKKKVISEFGEHAFDDAAIYPRVRAAKLIETAGLVDPKSGQKEANIDPFKYNVVGDPNIWVAGDARPMPFSKSGGTARSEGKYVSRVIAAKSMGKEVQWESPHTTCYSVVNAEPMEGIVVDAYYAFKDNSFGFDKVSMDQTRTVTLGKATLEWARGHYRDMFA
jgi:NADPH-dependent 2,4-dienoyl-CoA reductase/sulfur reductase-like enzyme